MLDGISMAATIRAINPYVKFVENESCFSTEDGRLTFSLALLLSVYQLGQIPFECQSMNPIYKF